MSGVLMHASDACIEMIKEFEGFPFGGRPYWDPWGKVWTQGFGDTGHGIGPASRPVSLAEAERRLRERLRTEYEPALNALNRTLGYPFTQEMFDAALDAMYNLGVGIIEPTHDFGRLLHERRYPQAAASLLEYDKAGGVVLPGLARRRQAEFRMFTRRPRFLEGYRPDEVAWIREYDSLRSHISVAARARLSELRRLMTARRKSIWVAAQGEGGWGALYRRARYRSLLARTT